MGKIQDILASDNLKAKRSLFSFDKNDSNEAVLLKYDLWGRYFFIKYFKSPDAYFHEDINLNNLKVYRGDIDAFVDAAFRGAGKDMKTKLFIPFCILNDLDHSRRYFKVLAEDGTNSKQSVTDIYNMLVNTNILEMYPETFEKSATKREETMSSFTTSTGVKVIADTVGVDQRGANQEETRPDFIWFNDFETRKTLRSARETKSIWENMEEARTGLEKGGGCVYTCNYISEMGNVHKLMTEKLSERKILLNIPIWDEDENITWPERYTRAEILQMQNDDDDFEGERLGKPSASKDILFDREILDEMEAHSPKRTIADFKIFREYDSSHRYGSGHDIAGGVGLDSSTSVFIDFDVIPCRVVATYKSNTIKPDTFGSEIVRQANMFGECLVAPEKNNHGHATIAILKQEYSKRKIYKTESKDTKTYGEFDVAKELGWHTNGATKPKMLFALKKAIEDGLLELTDKDLINEAKSYSRNDLMEDVTDPRLTTRHFDLLIACAIAWQLKDIAEVSKDVVESQKTTMAIRKNNFRSGRDSTK